MSGKRIGYVRVIAVEQNTNRHLDGIQIDVPYVDHASGKDTEPAAVASITKEPAGKRPGICSFDG